MESPRIIPSGYNPRSEAPGSCLHRLKQFVKFCVVGGSGVGVDMAVLHFLAEPDWLGWPVMVAKVCSAETAMLNNFLWNEVWTFRRGGAAGMAAVLWRLVKFHAICGSGIAWAVLLLRLFHTGLGMGLYVANLLAIVLVTLWNFGLNARLNWRER